MSRFSKMSLAVHLSAALSVPLITLSPIAHSAQLEEVVVTARKREESLQRTPVAVTVLSSELINDARLMSVKDIEALTPNLNFVVSADGSGSTLQAFIRGIGQFDFAVTTDPGVGMYVDGIYLARSIGANLEFSDIERISVLRGPQGTLFGKNTIGGAINVVTKAPNGETQFTGEVTAGSFGYTGAKAYAAFPLSDTVAGSISLIAKQSDGWQKRSMGDDAGAEDMMGLRAHLNTDFSSSWNSHLVVDTVSQDQSVYPRVLSDFDGNQFFPFLYNAFVLAPTGSSCCESNLANIDRSSTVNPRERDELDTMGVSWTNTWDLGTMSLKSLTGYRSIESEALRDSDNSATDFFSVETIFDTNQISQEFILSNNSGDVDWLVGAYYSKEDADHYSGVTVAGGLYEVLSSLPLEVTTPDGIPFAFLAAPLDLTLDYDRTQETESFAAFFNVTYSLNDRLDLNLAARYTNEEKTLRTYTIKRASQTPIAVPGPTAAAECSDVVAAGAGSQFTCSEKWSEFSPKIGLDLALNDDLLVYGHVSRGFRSGAFNGRPIATEEISVADPETVTAYEIGMKSQWMDRKVRFNGAFFYNDYKDQQFLVNQSNAASAAGLILLVDNAGESTLTGLELEMTALLGDAITVSASAAWLHPEYDTYEQVDFVTGQVQDLSYREFRDVPDFTASIYAQYEVETVGGGSLKLRADASYRDDIYYSNEETLSTYERLHASAFATVNAGVTYRLPGGAWEVGVYGRNLTDKREIIGGFGVDAFGSTDVAFNEPRKVFATIRYLGK